MKEYGETYEGKDNQPEGRNRLLGRVETDNQFPSIPLSFDSKRENGDRIGDMSDYSKEYRYNPTQKPETLTGDFSSLKFPDRINTTKGKGIERGSDGGVWQKSYDILMSGIHDEEKVRARERFLAENPEARIRVDTGKLKKIIDYVDFKCHPKCSVARDEAIKGSDIDAGLVVLSEPVSMEQQQAFVEELRSQGFDAYTQAEYEEAQREFDTSRVSPGITKRESNRIRFITKEELDEMSKNPIGIKPAMIYIAGKSIV